MNQLSQLAAHYSLLLYVDPGAGSLIWQLLLAAFFGGLFYFRKLIDAFLFRRNSRTKKEEATPAPDDADKARDLLLK
ncbi:MAG TPA: hypothetical protein VGB73_10540 [Pyrinomonadaceae bacterium]|jgi:cellulose synthase/poly-beta-1,6-N-acetylglucosamine synthase-like glycosyltransferase